MSNTRVEVDRFDGTGDFSLWKVRMMAHFGVLGLKEILNDEQLLKDSPAKEGEAGAAAEKDSQTATREGPELSPGIDPEKFKRSEQAKDLIVLNVGNLVLRKITHCETAASMWSTLNRLYMETSLPNRIYLQLKFYTFKMTDSKKIDENVDDFLKLVADLNNVGVEVTEEVQAILLLSSLSERYDQLKETLKYGRETLKLNEVIGAAKSKERELLEGGKLPKSQNEGLYVETRGRSEKRSEKGKGKQGRGRSKSKYRSKSKPKYNKNNKGCFICGKEGHWKRECPERSAYKPSSSANVAAEPKQPLVLTVSTLDTKDGWVMDSGCSFHITPNRDSLFDLQECDGGKVLMGNMTQSEVKGIGKIKIINPDESVVILTNVRYIPTMGRNLISYGQLETSGCKYEGKDFVVTFYKDGQKVISGKYQDGLYYLQGKVVTGDVAVAKPEVDKTSLWHSRLGHMSLKNMNVLVKEGYLSREEVDKLEFCESCVLGKSHKQSFPTAKHTTRGILEYIHSDLWGSPSTPESLGGCKYFVSFIDDFSRKVWVYFLKTKDEAFHKFREWKEAVENQTGKKIKYLRTDNGLEFCNTQFDNLCKGAGITRHRTCTYTPQQNGVSERMNRTIMDKVRSMLAETGLGQEFWAEATSTAVYLINRTPNSSIGFKLPEEVWTGTKPSLSHLRRFGCSAFVHVTQEKTSPRAVKGVFMGYPFGIKGYRVWLPEEGKCTTSRNVVFNENELFKTTQADGRKEESDKTSRRSKKSGKRVSFNNNLIRGPSTGYSDLDEASSQGGETSSSESSESSGSSGSSDSSEESETDKEGDGSENEQSLDDYVLARDRKRRSNIRPPSRFEDGDFVAYALAAAEELETEEPKSYEEAMKSNKRRQWENAAKEEMVSHKKCHTWDLIEKPENQKLIGCKWVFKLKPGIPGVEKQRYKARLVAKGFLQQEGIDYNEVFSPVVKHVSIRLMLSLVVNMDYELEQMDVKTAFLHGNLEERILMSQPEGFIQKGDENKVCLLRKSLYGLKQSPRLWNQRFDGFMKDQKFERSSHDPCVYMKDTQTDKAVYLLLYVDDMLIASGSMAVIQRLKDKLNNEFEMKDLGKASRILGMDIIRDRKKGELILSQGNYLEKVLKTFGMLEARSVITPTASHFKLRSLSEEEKKTEAVHMERVPYASAVGSLMYAMVGSRPDLAFAVGFISRFMSNPGRDHWSAVKWVLRYLKGAYTQNLTFKRDSKFCIEGFSDSDYASDLDRRRSVTGFVFKVGGNTISWKSSLQSVVALSTTEAEYMALTEAVKEAIWLKGLCSELGFKQGSVKVHCDSQSALALAKNSVHHERTKHIDTKFHFIRDIVSQGDVTLHKIHTTVNPADFLTKTVPGQKFQLCCELLNIH